MSKNNGIRYCQTCKNQLQKNGKDRLNKQRWRCVYRKTSKHQNRPASSKSAQLKLFAKWLLDKPTISQNTKLSRRTFNRQTKWCWNVIPKVPVTGEQYKVLLVDAVYIKRNKVCIVLRTPEFVVGWQWCDSENYEAFYKLFCQFPAPEYLVCDGNVSCVKAVKALWSKTKVQRCLFHILLATKCKLSSKPKTEAGSKLLRWVKYLARVDNKNNAVVQSMRFRFWVEDFSEFLNEKTYYISKATGRRSWAYTHKNLRAAYKHIKNAVENNSLFNYLIDENIPSTNNFLEGGINARLKELRRCHRGISLGHEQKMFEWYLLHRSEFGVADFIKKSTQNVP